MRALSPKPGEPYAFVRRACQYLGSYEYYAQRQVQLAKEQGAPANAVTPKCDPSTGKQIGKEWDTINDILNEDMVYFLIYGDRQHNTEKKLVLADVTTGKIKG